MEQSAKSPDFIPRHLQAGLELALKYCVITRGRKVWGVEIKAARSVTAADTKGLHRLAEISGSDFQSGIVFYDGESILPLANGAFLAVPISKLWEL